VLTAGNMGFLAAAHVYVQGANGALATGYAANGGGGGGDTGVPDGGATLALLGSAIMGLGLLRRKISKS